MPLCSFCVTAASVPSRLPPRPEGIAGKGPAGYHSHSAYLLTSLKDAARDDIGAPYHESLDAIRKSAATCPLCDLVLHEMDDFINNLRDDLRPRFDKAVTSWRFRLISREDKVDGYAVVAEDTQWDGGAVKNMKNHVPDLDQLQVIAVVGFCRRSGDVDLSALRGCMVESDAGKEVSLNRAAAFIQHCVDTHQSRCQPPEGPLPTRVLDVLTLWSEQKIKLIETKSSYVEGKYVALSHCWGGNAGHLKTTRQSLPRHLAGISMAEMPLNFQHAIKVTQHLAIRYLWIDSLCICQDDPDDWAREAAAMAGLYSRAHVVIAADSAAGSSAGFLNRPKRTYVPVQLSLSNGESLSAVAYTSPPQLTVQPETWMHLDAEPISQRGWTLQERLLPHRVLHYGTGQMFFECNEHFVSEDGFSAPGRWSPVYSGESKPELAWWTIINEYSRRNLTVESDKLPAIAGLAKFFHERLSRNQKQDVRYLAGLWSHSIVAGLGWKSWSQRMWYDWVPPEVPLPGEKGYKAPSWSWAALSGSLKQFSRPGLKDVAKVIDWGVKLKNEASPFGEVVDGWIKLRAPLFRVSVVEGENDDSDWTQWTEDDLFGHYVLLDQYNGKSEKVKNWLRSKDLFGVAIARMPGDDDPEWTLYYDALLVERHQGEVARYTRLGIMTFWLHKDPDYVKQIEDPDQVSQVLLV